MCIPCWPWTEVIIEDAPKKKKKQAAGGILYYDPNARAVVKLTNTPVSIFSFLCILHLSFATYCVGFPSLLGCYSIHVVAVVYVNSGYRNTDRGSSSSSSSSSQQHPPSDFDLDINPTSNLKSNQLIPSTRNTSRCPFTENRTGSHRGLILRMAPSTTYTSLDLTDMSVDNLQSLSQVE